MDLSSKRGFAGIMFSEIPLKTNLYNFSQSVTLDGKNYTFRFNFKSRENTYIMDILDDNNEYIESGLSCAVDVQLNRRIVNIMPGVLFFSSKDSSVSYADRTSLGTTVKLYYYLKDG